MIIPLVDKIIAGNKIVIPHSELLPQFVKNIVESANAMSRMDLLNRMAIIFIVLWLLKNFFEFCQS